MGTLRRRRPGDPDKALAKARDPEAARMAAVALLARRDFASGELRQKLGSQGYDAAVAAAVVAELTEERAIDDSRYAENYVAYHSGRGHGPVRIGADLRSLGVPADLVEAALETGPDWRAPPRADPIPEFAPQPPPQSAGKKRPTPFFFYLCLFCG